MISVAAVASMDPTASATIRSGPAPATVRGTENNGDIGVLTIDFPGGAGDDRLRPIDWDEWFKASGEDSTFFKLVRRNGS